MFSLAADTNETTVTTTTEAALKLRAVEQVGVKNERLAMARRQSALVAGSTDEAEVMCWIQDVSCTENNE